jgi:protein-arginine kinase activator protein McsA
MVGCSNPFKDHKFIKFSALFFRLVTTAQIEKAAKLGLVLHKKSYVCNHCRRKIDDFQVKELVVLDCDSNYDDFERDIQHQLVFDLNSSLQNLHVSPINKKKLNSASYSKKKSESVATAISEQVFNIAVTTS